jgi:hypothetical protein
LKHYFNFDFILKKIQQSKAIPKPPINTIWQPPFQPKRDLSKGKERLKTKHKNSSSVSSLELEMQKEKLLEAHIQWCVENWIISNETQLISS